MAAIYQITSKLFILGLFFSQLGLQPSDLMVKSLNPCLVFVRDLSDSNLMHQLISPDLQLEVVDDLFSFLHSLEQLLVLDLDLLQLLNLVRL